MSLAADAPVMRVRVIPPATPPPPHRQSVREARLDASLRLHRSASTLLRSPRRRSGLSHCNRIQWLADVTAQIWRRRHCVSGRILIRLRVDRNARRERSAWTLRTSRLARSRSTPIPPWPSYDQCKRPWHRSKPTKSPTRSSTRVVLSLTSRGMNVARLTVCFA
jgi:hypothetical protein